MGIFAKLAAEKGIGFTSSGECVNAILETQDFRRIRDLPRRKWPEDPNTDLLVDLLSEQLRTSHADPSARLRPIQAAALRDIHDKRGCFVTARVGAGKTLTGALAPTVLETARSIFVTRGGILEDTRAALFKLANDWRIAPLTMTSYTKLSRDYDNLILGRLRPQLLVLDECDSMQSTKSGCWQVVNAYVREQRKLEKAQGLPHGSLCVVVAMCGTPADQSLNQYWHIVRLALGDEAAPVPKDWREKNQWCFAMDAKVPAEARWQPGALVRLDPNVIGATEFERARKAYGSRFSSTAGVVTTGDARPLNKLHIHAVELQAPDALRQIVTDMRNTWTTPDGHPFEYPLDLYRHCREAQCGFYGVWDPRPPPQWLLRRKEWHDVRNDILEHSRTYRTPGHLVRAIEAGLEDDDGAWARWKEERDRVDSDGKLAFKPNPVPRWVDDSTAEFCAQWAEQNKGLIWVEFKALGYKLEAMAGIPFYRQGTMDSKGNRLEQHKKGYPAIASVSACKYGLNLQHIFSRNLYASPMSTNSAWEQSMGRTHRDGQPEDIVTVEVGMMVREAYSSMKHAIEKAEMVQATLEQGQKLAYADVRDLGAVESLIKADADSMWSVDVQAFL